MSWEFSKIHYRIWDDENFCTLPGDHQIVAIYLLANKEINRIGLYRLSVAMASEKLKVSPKVFHKRLKAVCVALHWGWDPKASVIFIPSWFKYYPIAKGAKTNLIGYMSDLRTLPKNNLIGRFKLNQAFIPSSMKELFLQQFQLHTRTPHRIPHRGGLASEIETEKEKEIETEKEIKTETANASFSFASDQKDSAEHRSPARPFLQQRSGDTAEPRPSGVTPKKTSKYIGLNDKDYTIGAWGQPAPRVPMGESGAPVSEAEPAQSQCRVTHKAADPFIARFPKLKPQKISNSEDLETSDEYIQ
jgi:hypothetical protein